MLSRLADNLYWMCRYMERAENTARMLDVQHQASLLGGSADSAQWQALLRLYELETLYRERFDDAPVTGPSVLAFMISDRENPASIWSSLQGARENARAVRTLLTPDLWEAVNSAWLELPSRLAGRAWIREPNAVLEWVKLQSHIFRGVLLGTMLQNQAFYFCRMGTYLERADNTARILDVKFLAHNQRDPASDYYYWANVLRSVSAFESYRQVYRDVVSPLRVAELLVQRHDMPRSLLACMQGIVGHLEQVTANRQSPSLRSAGRMSAHLQYLTVDEDFEENLHGFLTRFLAEVYDLGQTLHLEFLSPMPEGQQQSQTQRLHSLA